MIMFKRKRSCVDNFNDNNKVVKHSKNRVKNVLKEEHFAFLKDEHIGSTAIETTILLPLMFGTFIMLLYLLFMMLAYVTYGNIASNIAHQLNMRQTGYTTAVNTYYADGTYHMPNVYTYGVKESGDSRYAYTDSGVFLRQDQVVCNPDNKYLRSGTYFALDITGQARTGNNTMNMTGDQFIIPYVQVDQVRVDTSKPLNFDSGRTGTSVAANCVVKVSITFRTFNPLGVFNWYDTRDAAHGAGRYSSLLKITARGYDVIA